MASTIEKKEHSQVVISLGGFRRKNLTRHSRYLIRRTRTVSRFLDSARARFHTLLYASTTVKAFFMRMQSMRLPTSSIRRLSRNMT